MTAPAGDSPRAARTSRRRGHGEGALYRDERTGLWVGVIELDRDGTGRRRRVYRRGRTKADVLAKLAKVRTELDAGRVVADHRTTVEQYLDTWLSDHLPGQVKPSTADGYEWMLRKHVIPRIGTVRLGALTPEHVERMLRDMDAVGLSASTRRQARVVLGRALNLAEKRGRVSRNAARLADAPKAPASRLDDRLDATDARRVLAAAKNDRLRALAELVLRLGVRQGEALALHWSDLTGLDGSTEATLSVRHTLKRRRKADGGGWYLDTPKTSTSLRTIPVPDPMVAVFRQHRAAQAAERLAVGAAWNEQGFVFTTPIGTPLEARNVLRWWHDLCESAKVGRRRFHAARHTTASLLLEAGEPLERVSAILGHSSLAITADIYAHVSPRARRATVGRLDDVLGA
jgi:integrase